MSNRPTAKLEQTNVQIEIGVKSPNPHVRIIVERYKDELQVLTKKLSDELGQFLADKSYEYAKEVGAIFVPGSETN